MFRIFRLYFAALPLALLSLSSCAYDEGNIDAVSTQPEMVQVSLHVGASEMRNNIQTRADEPMAPDMENTIKTLAIMQFDQEGMHIKKNNFHFVDFTQGTIDGVRNPDIPVSEDGVLETTLGNISLVSQTGTLCLVANVTEEQINDMYEDLRQSGQTLGNILLSQFKQWQLTFEYTTNPEGDATTDGHINRMYMFGYYEGSVDADNSENINIVLGRLASRIDITISNETGHDITGMLSYHFDNVCHKSYVFPGATSADPDLDVRTHTIVADPENGRILSAGAEHTASFYVAANSASNLAEATKLHLFYGGYTQDDMDDNKPSHNLAEIPLGNMPPEEAAQNENGYWLDSNTLYSFTIHLKSKSTRSIFAASTRNVDTAASQTVPWCGDITVYLP